MDFSLKDLPQFAIIFIIATIVISVGSNIIGDIKDTQEADTDSALTETNDTLNLAANNTYYGTTYLPLISVTGISNDTDILPSELYASDSDQGVRIYANATYLVGVWNVTYTWKSSMNITASGLKSMEELGDWLPTMALIVAAMVVIGVIIFSFKDRFG